MDSIGRWILRAVDYRVYAIVVLATSIIFVIWRRWHYESWPSRDDYLNLVIGLLGISGGLPVGVVFLMTKPPAVDMLSGSMLAAIGLLVPIVCLAFGWPRSYHPRLRYGQRHRRRGRAPRKEVVECLLRWSQENPLNKNKEA